MASVLMDKLHQTGQILGRVFSPTSGCTHAMHFHPYEAKQPILKWKTRPLQLLGCFPLDVMLPAVL
jgi:hypothetical protein